MSELEPGWLDRQIKEVRDDVATWPEWMRRAGGFMDERRSEMTPEQREDALKLADELRSVAIDSRLDMKPICLMMDGAKAIRDLHAENAEHNQIIDNLCAALFPNSPIDSARAEFMLDAMGACQVIRRLHVENVRLREALNDAPHEEDCAYIGSLLRFDKFNGRKLPTVRCDCWKSRALAGSPATEAGK